MEITRREKIGLAVFSTIILLLISIIYYRGSNKNDITVVRQSENIETQSKIEKDIKVYICGEVIKPGVYSLKDGERLYKLIELSGGFTENAAKENLNLAMKLKDEDYIFVPNKNVQVTNNANNSDKINLNTANIEELKKLPRIGDALAQRIIDFREKNGPFKDIKDIKNVSGIGDKMFESIKDKITVR
ncbi:ComE operon protein 1 [Caloramator mitchellensis]|uniref:ComE operon protein 1 n=1 Tax=Caloramator mitchellensis TaxID=908809 RepID=A0A0R3JRA8_CALMK|nr:ComEA family DNA-binding protein [Caloramator mitchellensis]KRQ86007.1 ComE operon protein 1 [Caloramator mitchellensis]